MVRVSVSDTRLYDLRRGGERPTFVMKGKIEAYRTMDPV